MRGPYSFFLGLFVFLLLASPVASRRKLKQQQQKKEDAVYAEEEVQGKPTPPPVSSYLHEPEASSSFVVLKDREEKLGGEKIEVDDLLAHYYKYHNGDTSSPSSSANGGGGGGRGKRNKKNDGASSNPASTFAFKGERLLYVTPWNRRGYEAALILARQNKLEWLVPAWFQIRRNEHTKAIEIVGEHEVEQKKDWLASIRQQVDNSCTADSDQEGEEVCSSSSSSGVSRRKIKIVPRVVLETTLADHKDCVYTAKLLLALMEKHNLDGYTFEIVMTNFEVAVTLPRLLKEMGTSDSSSSSKSRKGASPQVVFVLPPMDIPALGTTEHAQLVAALKQLGEHVDRFSVMTYDFSKQGGEPNAPIQFVAKVMMGLAYIDAIRHKLLLGLPLYGWKTGGQDMTGENIILWLASKRNQIKIYWEDASNEHLFVEHLGQGEKEYLASSYPTPLFLAQRLRLADELQIAGVALWEGGQAMPYLFDYL